MRCPEIHTPSRHVWLPTSHIGQKKKNPNSIQIFSKRFCRKCSLVAEHKRKGIDYQNGRKTKSFVKVNMIWEVLLSLLFKEQTKRLKGWCVCIVGVELWNSSNVNLKISNFLVVFKCSVRLFLMVTNVSS